ncbi:NUMOD3 domain-containing DNA-binding protein [Clostridium scatologenes]|uniref:GIY-YIG domain-containing protein n=1 Tax=Clostridium scatologenes TaxID=1548 RepID=A0A0E3K1P2_CLOSL|nr:NUMOD3 domain-containing DNA-binding protein [Clostridium scatologenes]AKA70158.1 GIY-YIG domain-containing protein [Clostridium scatologenes]
MSKKKNMTNGVYAWIVSEEENELVRYVGSGKNIDYSRKSNHLANLRQNKHKCKELQELFNKYGEENFTFKVLEITLIRDTLIREQYYKEMYKDTVLNKNDVLNTKKNIRTGLKAKQFKEKMSELNRGENNPNCNTSEETIIDIKKDINIGLTNKELCKKYDKSDSYVSNLKYNKTWSHIEIECFGEQSIPDQQSLNTNIV